MGHWLVLCDCPKTVWHCICLAEFQVQSVSKDTAVRESGDSMGNAHWTAQAGLCNYLCFKDTMSPPTLPLSHSSPREEVPYSHTTSQNTPGFHSLFLCRGTNLCSPPCKTLSHLLIPLPPWRSLSLPSYPWGCSFLNCKKLKVTVVRAEVSLLGIWQEAYTHSCPILPFLPDRLQPICQLINCRLLCPKPALCTRLIGTFWGGAKLIRKAPLDKAQHGVGGVTHEHPLPTSVSELSQEGHQAQNILSWGKRRAVQKELTFKDHHLSHFMKATLDMLLGLGDVGWVFLK